uniref:Uncharacterized protein n=1 Tax=Cacopsylla melanoneura TaxID=428564 RepID=A0A8D8LD97_9HEMI
MPASRSHHKRSRAYCLHARTITIGTLLCFSSRLTLLSVTSCTRVHNLQHNIFVHATCRLRKRQLHDHLLRLTAKTKTFRETTTVRTSSKATLSKYVPEELLRING